MTEDTPGVWEGVRRALGRLFASARVRDLPPERLTATAVVLSAGGRLEGFHCVAGAREGEWRPDARVVEGRRPAAVAGADGVDLAPIATVIGLNAALRPEAVETLTAPPLPAACTAHRLDIGSAVAATVHAAAVALPAGGAREAAARVSAPAVRRLPLDPPQLPGAERARRFGRPPPPANSWRLTGARVRSGMGVVADVPLTRARRLAPPGLAAVERETAERRLAETSGVAAADILLLGVFPQVPVAAVRRLALEEGGGALSLWLKPEALALAAAGKSPRLATLVIGRQRSTGRMLQTVIQAQTVV